ncbi:hypothetical protein, partial [Rhodoblastus acidophilus]|uniref:hypothetical protein n=1 Tax=Rhodoblastus acidophilus TaxID=1074 RepID=UPI002224F22A
HFVNCYGQCEYGWLVYAELGPFVNSVFDIHGGALNLKNYLAVNTTAGNSEFVDCKFTEYFMFTTGPLITTFGGPGTLSFTSCELSVSNALTNQPLFFPNGTSVHYHGVIKLGDAASAGTYNLSALTSLTGDVFVKGTLSSVTGPTTGAYRIISAYDKGIQHVGNIYAKIGIKEGNGTNITAASTINIPQDGSFFSVMGTTAVSKINVGSWDEGRTITLRANDGFTLTNSYANNLILASTFNMAANNTITLRCSAGKWWEVCRCANALT